jgi:YebC/PmpR family DNA-binding regulatory protein
MGRAFEFRKARKLKRWGNMARTFTRIGKQIAIAVKAGGPDPENNPHLRAIIATAKNENMPKDNIERAIKNAMGKDEKEYKEMNYEGYGPFGIAILVETATDNSTRTVANVRSIFNKFSGNMGTMGSLDFMFTHKSMFTVAMKEGLNVDDLILEMIDLDVEEDYELDEEEGELTVYGSPKSFNAIQKYFEENGFEVKSAEFTRIPAELKDVTPEQRETIDKMVERFEDDEDVQNVYTNMKPLDEDEEA